MEDFLAQLFAKGREETGAFVDDLVRSFHYFRDDRIFEDERALADAGNLPGNLTAGNIADDAERALA